MRIWSTDLPAHVGERVTLKGWLHRLRQLSSVTPAKAGAYGAALAVVNPKVLFICAAAGLAIGTAWGGINLARIGPRKLALAGGVLFAAGYALAAIALAVKSLMLFYLGYGAVAGIGIGLGYVTPMSTVTKWSPTRRDW